MNKLLLMRDNLSDQGQVPSTGSYYSSPDLIVHDQVADAQTFFTNNYDQDVNQSINKGSGANFIYARVKNLSPADTLTAYVHLYASTSSLFMNPSLWKKNRICSLEGASLIPTQPMLPGAIGVVTEPFIFNAKVTTNYCHVGYVAQDSSEPDIPDRFNSYSDFTVWLQNNTHICLRNFWTLQGQQSNVDQINEFSNPSETEERVGTFNIQLMGRFPVGTTIQVKCPPIGLDSTYTVKVLQDMTQIPVACIIPPGISAYLVTSVYLPSGSVWPKGGSLKVTFYVSESWNGAAFRYSIPASLLGIPKNAPDLFQDQGRLIKVGECSTRVVE